MKNFRQMLFQIVLAAIVLFSCKKERTIINVKSTEYFPNEVGNYWEYEVYDSSRIREHTDIPRQYQVRVTIIGIKKLADNIDAMIWKYEYPWGNEIKYFRNSSDTIKIYDTTYSNTLTSLLYPRLMFIQPFTDRQEWAGKLLWVDSFFVSKENSASFINSFLISRKYAGQGSYDFSSFSFSEKIGFTKIHCDEINQGIRTIELWQLQYYNLK
jgi:hypothetical protein